jgi:hypothetical protein
MKRLSLLAPLCSCELASSTMARLRQQPCRNQMFQLQLLCQLRVSPPVAPLPRLHTCELRILELIVLKEGEIK